MKFRGREVDRSTVILIAGLVGVVVVYTVLVVVLQRFSVGPGQPSSTYGSGPTGLGVCYDYLDALGMEPARWERFDSLPQGGTLVAAAPFYTAPTEEETVLVAEWVRTGGRLVLVGQGAEALAERLGVDGLPTGGGDEPMTPRLPSAYTRGVEEVALGGDRLLVSDPSWVSHYRDLAGQGLVSRLAGQGEVVWLASAYPLSNEGIGEADNAALAVLLAGGSGGQVAFDEYHHGYVTGGSMWDLLGSGRRAAVVLVAIAVVAALVAWSTRLAPPIERELAPWARTGAYASSLAELYRRAGARADALEALADGLTRALAKRHGTVDVGLARHGVAGHALDRARALARSGRIDEDEFVRAAASLGRARREVEGKDV